MYELGKIAGGFMAVLRGQPLSLALVAMNVVLLFFVFKTAQDYSSTRRYMADLITKQYSEMFSTMAKCIDVDQAKQLIEVLKVRP